MSYSHSERAFAYSGADNVRIGGKVPIVSQLPVSRQEFHLYKEHTDGMVSGNLTISVRFVCSSFIASAMPLRVSVRLC